MRLSIGEFARATGLSERALRFYEQKGLLAPARSKDNGRRYYDAAELEAVQKILALKSLGFTLAEVSAILTGRRPSLPRVLAAQLSALEAKRAGVETSIRALEAALLALEEEGRLEFETLIELIRMTNMNQKLRKDLEPAYARHFTEEQREQLARRRPSEEEQRRYTRDWHAILAEARDLVGTDPAAPEAQAVAKRARKMIEGFTRGDPGLESGLKSMYSEVDQWAGEHAEAMFGMPLADYKKVQAFLQEAHMAGRKAAEDGAPEG